MADNADNGATIQGIPVAKVQLLIDRMEIRDVLGRYTRGIDRHDVEILKTVFWPDAQINYTSSFSGPTDDFIVWGNGVHERSFVIHEHHITNQNVDIDGDVAHVESYVLYLLRRQDGQQDFGAGRYMDVLERRNGEWRILQREFIPEMRFESPSTHDASTIPEWLRGRWDRDDVSFMRPLPRRPESEALRPEWMRT